MVTPQGGSVTWREVQNPAGGDYGHHMSKAAANMGSKLLAQELKHEGIMVQVLHPGFNKTDMTLSTPRFGKSKARSIPPSAPSACSTRSVS